MADCGTGLGNFPQPGDPDLNGSTFGCVVGNDGIYVNWTYPPVLTEAVAYVLIYRNTVDDWDAVSSLGVVVNGSQYFDRSLVSQDTTYFYWMKMVSVNGTIGDLIGPTSCTMKTDWEQTIALLNNRVKYSELYTDLKTEIDSIAGFDSSLTDEINDRVGADTALGVLIAVVETDMGDLDTLVVAETTDRIVGDAALVTQIDAIAATSGGNTAAILTEATVRADADSATAFTIGLIGVENGGGTAFILDTNTVKIDSDGGDTLAERYTQLSVTDGDNAADIVTQQGITDDLEAEYFVKLDVNDHVAGFGIVNDGGSSLFLVNATTFAIGNGVEADAVPFTVGLVGGQSKIVLNAATFIADATIVTAHITDLTVTGAKIANLTVDTLQIAGNAITIATGAFTAAATSSINATYVEVQSVTWTATGQPVQVQFSVSMQAASGGARGLIGVALMKGGSLQQQYYPQYIKTASDIGQGTFSFIYQFTPAAGSTTMSVDMNTGQGGGSAAFYASLRSLVVTEIKK